VQEAGLRSATKALTDVDLVTHEHEHVAGWIGYVLDERFQLVRLALIDCPCATRPRLAIRATCSPCVHVSSDSLSSKHVVV